MSFNTKNKVRDVIYISGGISGNPNHQDHFFKAANYLALNFHGAEIKNPLNIPEPSNPREDVWGYFMKRSISMLMECNIIYMLEGWQNSRGASLEHKLALELGLQVWYEKNGGKDNDCSYNTSKDNVQFKELAKNLGWEVKDISHDKRCIDLLRASNESTHKSIKPEILYD